MIPVGMGPSQRHLKEMAEIFRGGKPHPGYDATPDGAHGVSNDGREISYDGKVISDVNDAGRAYDPKGQLSPSGVVPDELPRNVAVSPDGKFVLYSVPDPTLLVHGQPRTLIVQKEQTGLFFKSFSSPPVICFDLDGTPASLDISPLDSSLAIAFDNQVGECSSQHMARMRVQVPERLADARYLSDGSLALCTERQEDGHRFYFVPADSSQAVPVALRDFDPQALRQQQLDDLKWARLTDADVDAFQQQNPFLFNANGTVVPYGWVESPKDAKQVLVLAPGAVVTTRIYDVDTRQSRSLGQLEDIPFPNLTVAWEHDGRMLAAWDKASPNTAVHVYDTVNGGETVLPEASDVRYDNQTLELCFTPPGGAPTRMRMADVAQVAQQPWYAAAHERYLQKLQSRLMPGEAAKKAAAPVEVADAFITVNGVKVPRKNS